MQTLIDAVAQVTSNPVPGYPFLQPMANGVTPLPVPSNATPVNMGGIPWLCKRKHDDTLADNAIAPPVSAKRARTSAHEDEEKRTKRLEQNRLAAIESRRRKKHMVEELQRSVHYYSKSNASLKSQNAELEKQILIAKQKMLMNRGNEGVLCRGAGETLALANGGRQVAAATREAPLPKQSSPRAEAHKKSVIGEESCAYSALLGKASNAEMQEQAQQAQFAATQALYKSMGYPAGAARFAASTFAQFVSQSGTALGYSAAGQSAPSPTSAFGTSSASSASTMNPHVVNNSSMFLVGNPSPQIKSDDTTYIEALNRFAMQQAAAANAAAAAAAAAIEAAHLHNQFKMNGGSPSTQIAPPVLPFSCPSSAAWTFQNRAGNL